MPMARIIKGRIFSFSEKNKINSGHKCFSSCLILFTPGEAYSVGLPPLRSTGHCSSRSLRPHPVSPFSLYVSRRMLERINSGSEFFASRIMGFVNTVPMTKNVNRNSLLSLVYRLSTQQKKQELFLSLRKLFLCNYLTDYNRKKNPREECFWNKLSCIHVLLQEENKK